MPSRFSFDSSTHGVGGFAKVIKGRDNALERDVAVKVLNPLATKFSTRDQERFKREARILAKLTHPNIPAIYDVDLTAGSFLIIFQFINGTNLRQILEKEGAIPLSSAKLWFAQIASALDHAHSLGVVHRDIKPETIVITPNRETAYVVDFGIALTKEDSKHLTEDGYVIGTPGYMSPEQQAGEELDYRTDVYSLSVTLYEVLAGKRVPFGNYQDLSSLNESIPPQIDDLILECLLPKDKRTLTASGFTQRLATAFVPARPLSEILSHGRLHELCNALQDLSPSDFANLPEGQRALILAKTANVVSSGEDNLIFAGEQLLQLLLPRAVLLPKEEYREIVKPSLVWGYEQQFGDYKGSNSIRTALETAAQSARGEALHVLIEECIDFMGPVDFAAKPDWYMHHARMMIQTVLANPGCSMGASDLVKILKNLNDVQRSRRTAERPEQTLAQ